MAEKMDLRKAFDKAKKITKAVAEGTGKAIEASKPVVSKAIADGKVAAEKAINDSKPVIEKAIKDSKPVIEKAAKKTAEAAVAAKDKSVELAIKGKEELMLVLDQNGNGEIDVEDIIVLGMRTPGVKINRAAFLKKELFKLYPEEVVNKAIKTTPMEAGIKKEDIDNIADEVIKAERYTVSGASAALSVPGGIAMLATIPADMAQYYGVMLRVMQKLLYLYGFPEINLDTNGQILDSETLNELTICLGVMYGVMGANNALKAMAKALATGVEKKLIKAALTKGAFYPAVKEIAEWFGKKMTKEIFAGFFKEAIPVVGGLLGGGITFFVFKPCCDRLKVSLQDTYLSNPDHREDEPEDIIDVDVKPKAVTNDTEIKEIAEECSGKES